MQNITDAVITPQTNRVMRTFKRTLETRYNSNTIYGQRFSIPIPRGLQGLSQIYVKNTIACTGDNTAVLPFLGAKLWTITIQTKSGVVLLNQRPQYCIERVQELGDPSNNPLVNSLNPYVTFNNVTTNCITPVFPYFSDRTRSAKNIFFNTLNTEPCEMIFESALTKEELGLLFDLTLLRNEVMFRCYEPLVTLDLVPRMDKGFDIFYEPNVTGVTGQSEISIDVICPFDVYKSSFAVSTSSGASVSIRNVRISQKNTDVIDIDRTQLFSMYAEKMIYYQTSSVFPLYYTQDMTRSENNLEFQSFNGQCYPTRITVSFDTQALACTLRVHHEYRQFFMFDKHPYDEHLQVTRPLMNRFESNNNNGTI